MKYKCINDILPFKKSDEVVAEFHKQSKTYSVFGLSVVQNLTKQQFEENFKKIL